MKNKDDIIISFILSIGGLSLGFIFLTQWEQMIDFFPFLSKGPILTLGFMILLASSVFIIGASIGLFQNKNKKKIQEKNK